MRKLFALLALAFGLAACSPPAEVKLPDSNVKYENGAATYKGKPYTGKILISLKEKAQGFEGVINLKDGHLEGLTEVSSKDGEKFKATVLKGKFDGDYVLEEGPSKVHLVFQTGKLRTLKINAPNVQQNLTVAANGNVSGKIIIAGETVELKDGIAEKNGKTLKMRMLDNGKVQTELYQKDQLINKEESTLLEVTPQALEQRVFEVVLGSQ